MHELRQILPAGLEILFRVREPIVFPKSKRFGLGQLTS